MMVFFMVLASLVIAIDSARSAKRMPADQGGIAGWLRWYAVTITLGTVVGIFVAYVTLVGSGFGTGGAIAGTLLYAVFLAPPAIAAWIKRPAARIVILCWLFGYVVIGTLLVVLTSFTVVDTMTLSECTASGFLDSGLTVFASTPPRPARGGRVAPGPGFGSRTSPASTARCTSA